MHILSAYALIPFVVAKSGYNPQNTLLITLAVVSVAEIQVMSFCMAHKPTFMTIVGIERGAAYNPATGLKIDFYDITHTVSVFHHSIR